MKVDFIVLRPDYVERLVTTKNHEQFEKYKRTGVPLVKFPLPLEESEEIEGYDYSYLELKGDHLEWGGYSGEDIREFVEEEWEIRDFLVKNREKSPYEVLFVKGHEYLPDESRLVDDFFFLNEEDYPSSLAEVVPSGSVVFRRKDKEPMDIATYIPLFRAMCIHHCAIFDFISWRGWSKENIPNPCSIDILEVEGKKALVCHYDSESG